ncbi:MAG TPA: hypothetical protein VMR18_04940 [Candidatus Saccharimonadales bacterium]|jgi:ribulose-phosphate 3-epimerase|nr:hypothetical protein [Candidatus Saccharimonadales bacterium]
MAADICPTITVNNPKDYQSAIGMISRFALRIHIDLANGTMTPSHLVDVDKVWWPGGVRADLHVMYKQPFVYSETYLALAPQLVIVQAEAEGDFDKFSTLLHGHGVEVGVALLADTPTSLIESSLEFIDHVMIFSGNLGYYGGQADLSLLPKVKRLKSLKPRLEIGWDGGINDTNIRQLADGGVDVLNVGSYIGRAHNPDEAYATLESKLSS